MDYFRLFSKSFSSPKIAEERFLPLNGGTMKAIQCPKCDYAWYPRIENPKQCPNCRYMLWSDGKMREEVRRLKQEGSL